jgi:hypothetical protein
MNDRDQTSPPGPVERENLSRSGRRYQVLFRILDLVSHESSATVLEQVCGLPDHEVTRVFETYYPDLPPSERRRLVEDFLQQDADALAMSNVLRAVTAYKRRGLNEFMAHVHPFSVANRRRRMDGELGRKDTPRYDMTVARFLDGQASGRIVKAAVLYKDFVWSKPSPMRHSDIINEMFDILGGNVDSIQTDGFVSASGHFLDRRGALVLARDSGQEFIEEPVGDELFSENIW